MRSMSVRVLGGVTGLLILAATPGAAVGQSALEEVERLARLGRTDEARTVLMSWWEGDREDASRRELQRGLWLRGRLTVDPVQAELDFQRLAVLYPSGPFTADALLRLAQASWAMGNEDGARRYMQTLEQDYRRTEAWERAQAWMAEAGPLPPPGDTPTAPAPAPSPRPDTPPATTPVRTETRPPSTRRADPPARADDEEEPSADAGTAAMNYYVQLGAFADEERARSLYDEVRAQGIDVRIVTVVGSQFTHVRVGRFAQRASAVELLEELTARGINAALVRDDREERPAGG